MAVLTVDNISKNYGDVQALSNISFSVEEGELFGLVGPDGAGKSTLFNILTTLMLPTSGTATVLGKNLFTDYKEIRSHIGYLPGTFSLYPDLSVEENLIFFATMYKTGIRENMSLIAPIWRQISPFRTRPAGKLSGGMKQKLALCCALIHKPKILFLDEPTTGVDPVSRREFWDLLKNIKKYGVTVVVSTPYMDEATRCDRIALVQEGEIIVLNSPTGIVEEFKGSLFSLKTSATFSLLQLLEKFPVPCSFYPFGEYMHIVFYGDVDNKVKKLQEFLDQHKHPYSHFESIEPTIEDCFIELVKGVGDV